MCTWLWLLPYFSYSATGLCSKRNPLLVSLSTKRLFVWPKSKDFVLETTMPRSLTSQNSSCAIVPLLAQQDGGCSCEERPPEPESSSLYPSATATNAEVVSRKMLPRQSRGPSQAAMHLSSIQPHDRLLLLRPPVSSILLDKRDKTCSDLPMPFIPSQRRSWSSEDEPCSSPIISYPKDELRPSILIRHEGGNTIVRGPKLMQNEQEAEPSEEVTYKKNEVVNEKCNHGQPRGANKDCTRSTFFHDAKENNLAKRGSAALVLERSYGHEALYRSVSQRLRDYDENEIEEEHLAPFQRSDNRKAFPLLRATEKESPARTSTKRRMRIPRSPHQQSWEQTTLKMNATKTVESPSTTSMEEEDHAPPLAGVSECSSSHESVNTSSSCSDSSTSATTEVTPLAARPHIISRRQLHPRQSTGNPDRSKSNGNDDALKKGTGPNAMDDQVEIVWKEKRYCVLSADKKRRFAMQSARVQSMRRGVAEIQPLQAPDSSVPDAHHRPARVSSEKSLVMSMAPLQESSLTRSQPAAGDVAERHTKTTETKAAARKSWFLDDDFNEIVDERSLVGEESLFTFQDESTLLQQSIRKEIYNTCGAILGIDSPLSNDEDSLVESIDMAPRFASAANSLEMARDMFRRFNADTSLDASSLGVGGASRAAPRRRGIYSGKSSARNARTQLFNTKMLFACVAPAADSVCGT